MIARRWLLPAPLLLLLLACVLPEIVVQLGDKPDFLRSTLIQNFAFWPGLLKGWHPNYPLQPVAMFVTYGFLHAGIWHLGFNMLTLISLGRSLYEDLGGWRFCVLYAAGLIGGAVGFALLSSRPFPMVGASGALFGLAGALLWQSVTEAPPTLAGIARLLAMPLALLIGLNVVMYWGLHGQLAWETHLGGFLAGLGAMALLLPRAGSDPETPR